MKIGIVTIPDMTNYGNRLQNYAVCQVLRTRFGCRAESLAAYREKPFENGNYVLWLKNQMAKAMCLSPRLAEKKFGPGTLRWRNFTRWTRRHIPTRDFYGHSALPEGLNEEYDLFFAGSDQIWNYRFPGTKYDDYFLKFAEHSKKAAICGSFGVDSIPDEWKKTYTDGLSGFAHISVREEAGARIVEELTGRDVPVLADPVMLLTPEEWLRVAEKPRVDLSKPYVLKYHLGDEAEEEKIDRWAKEQGWQIYELLDPQRPELYAAGPGEFISLIANAALVASDSFHCIAFSILFRRPFLVYARRGECDMTSRLDTLLGKFGLEHRWKHRLTADEYLHCNYSGTEARLEAEREKALAYIRRVLDSVKDHYGPALAPGADCTGCTACAAACTRGCITMAPDARGFAHPAVDTEKCVSCGLCEKACPVLHPPAVSEAPEACAAYTRDQAVRRESSSGGIFSELAQAVLRDGGAVFGAAYGADFEVVHTCVEDVSGLARLRSAKYAQSGLEGIFAQVRHRLAEGQPVLFSGTPCQVAGLKTFLGKEYPRLYTVDFVCHGVPSPLAWQKYVRHRAAQDNGGRLPEAINLRSKETGWSRYRYSNAYEYGGHRHVEPSGENLYMKLFVEDCISRSACESCRFKGYGRCSDLTLGDFWGIWDIAPGMDDDRGTSLVLVQSEKGRALFDRIKGNCALLPVTLAEAGAQNPSLLQSSPASPHREAAWAHIRADRFDQCASLFTPHRPSPLKRVLRKIKSLIS